ncbi:putative bifunctional diguanylate cyclase/phosphodiesterase [Blastococcus mobilis]|uniref:Diguanylate cyclase (GGDEF) domain-containing protein n=1 Tax=Blastococcus mobilis TaxID=1938746 RepID=A0A238X269_9ACTN|nr:bifunctional diguanylate cyclase/phosphodiesterase [Blastococcus mobilis]SNR52678.1 diguanylate cyclase (GGDEF) domain-containing protein [Blastococcus mobilis]
MTTMTNGGLAADIRRFRMGSVQRVWVLTASLATAAATLFVIVVQPLPTPATTVALPWVGWAVAFAISEVIVVHVPFQREAHTFSLGDVLLAAGMLVIAPADLVLAQVVGAGVALLLYRRQRGTKLAFNAAALLLGSTLAVIVFAALTDEQAGSNPWHWLAALVAVLVLTVTSDVCIFAVISLSEGRADWRRLPGMLTLSLPFSLGAGAVGLVVERTAMDDPAALALLAVPTGLVFAAYRAYTRARKQEENLRVLHETTSLLYTGDADTALGQFLAAVRNAFAAGVAELVLLGEDGSATLSRSRDGQEPVALAPLEDPEQATRLVDCCATATGTSTTRTGAAGGQALDRYAADRGLKDAMVSVLGTEGRTHGLLLVGDRLGDVATFDRNDLALLETFARHVATSLERGRLEHDLRQVTDLKEKLRHQAMHDALTGLPNRTLFLDRTEHALALAGRNGLWPAVLYIDLDGFKPVNDTHGHEAGDVLLRAFAERLHGCLRAADTAARLGGDEFAVLLHGPIDESGVQRVLDRIRAELTLPIDLGAGRVATVGASIGVAIADAAIDVGTLVQHADAAMYAAKRGGRGISRFYEPGLGEDGSTRPDPGAELAAGLARGEFTVHYQPLVDLRTGRAAGAEALVRWEHPTDGFRPPDTFIPLAEDTGLIAEIGAFVLRDACRQAARWTRPDDDGPAPMVTVNLSAQEVTDPRTVEQVRAALAEAKLDPYRLVLEITETVLMQDREAATRNLRDLKALGVRVAIDDFGTGYSSLAYLCTFPLDMLKVAREFVDGLGRDANADVVTRAVVDLAGALGLLTVAEGIETAHQQEHVAQLGCDLAQGYLFSRPVDAETVLAVMTGEAAPAGVVVPTA